MFLENESELCECRATVFFGGDKFTPTCLVLHRLPYFSENFLFVNYRHFNLERTFPLRMKKKIQQQQQQKQKKEKKEKKTESMDL